jgi:hypothetical protein
MRPGDVDFEIRQRDIECGPPLSHPADDESTTAPFVLDSMHEEVAPATTTLSAPRMDFFAVGPDQDSECCCSGDSRRGCFVSRVLCSECTWRCGGTSLRSCSRIGNFTVLLERLAVQPPDADGALAVTRRYPILLLGPYWPCCVMFTTVLVTTIPAILVLVFWSVLPRWMTGIFMAVAGIALVALSSVACRNPGLVEIIHEEPQGQGFVYNDVTRSWRPQGTRYSGQVNALVRDFDHVCPFTGTAIGAGNMISFLSFQISVSSLIYLAVGYLALGLYYTATQGYAPPFRI